jgi:membrane dipeptidase
MSVSRRKLLGVVVPVVVAALVAGWLLAGRKSAERATVPAAPDTTVLAQQIHARTLVLDTHADILLPDTPAQYRDSDGDAHTSLAKLKAGGVGAIALALAVGPGPRDAAGVKAARAEVDAKYARLQEFVNASNGAAVSAKSADEIEAAHRDGKIAVITSFLNARSLGHNLAALDEFYAKGVRIFGLAHAGHNDWADSSRPQKGEPVAEHHGLSPLGKQAIARLNDLGVVVDVSQLTPEGVQQVLATTRAPVIASHSDVRALVDNTRNLTDAEIDAIGKNGGVISVVPFNAYLRVLTPAIRTQLGAVRTKYGLPPEIAVGVSPNDGYPTLPADKQAAFNDAVKVAVGRASVSDLIDHLDYIVKRIGIEHVGVGTDFDHGSGIVGLENAADAGNVTAELVRRGYSEADIQKIWSGNFLRVLRAVEAARKS